LIKKLKKGKLSKAMIDKNEEFKQKVIQSTRDLRVGLANLERRGARGAVIPLNLLRGYTDPSLL
jgi:hypothetical protein